MRGLRRLLIVGSFVATAASPVAVQEPATPPVGLGAVVLLATHNDHSADADLRKALLDGDPRVRIVAGRAIAVVPHHELLPALVAALARSRTPRPVPNSSATSHLRTGRSGVRRSAVEASRRARVARPRGMAGAHAAGAVRQTDPAIAELAARPRAVSAISSRSPRRSIRPRPMRFTANG
jgi:HEAT repeat protein